MANPITASGISSPQSIYTELSVSHHNQERPVGHHDVGTRATLPDGRVFRYALVGDGTLGGDVTRGQLCVSSNLTITGHTNITLPAQSGNGGAESKKVIVDFTTTDVVANQYKDGYLLVNDADGEGFAYKIRSHGEQDVSDTSSTFEVELYDPIQVALLSGASQVAAVRNPYDKIGPSTTAEEEATLGVSLISTSGNSLALATNVAGATTDGTSYFIWVQTWGPAPVLVGSTGFLGRPVMSGSAAGEVESWAYSSNGSLENVSRDRVGRMLRDGVDTEFTLVDLTIAP